MPATDTRAALPAVLFVLGAIAFYWRTAWTMLDTWLRSDTFAHGLVVVPIALWLGWRERHRFDAAAIRPFLPALLALLGAGALWLVSQLAVVNVGRQFALVFMLQAGLIALLGWWFARTFAFPLAFLLFAVPFGEFTLPTLMEWTADFTVASLRLTGVPVYREGMDFVIPSGSWSVVEECSGVRYLIASFMGGTLFAYLAYRSIWRRLAFMLLALAVPIVANWVRAYLIVMLGHLSDNKIAAGVDHLIYGWLFFGVVVFLLFWLGAIWREPRSQWREPRSQWGEPRSQWRESTSPAASGAGFSTSRSAAAPNASRPVGTWLAAMAAIVVWVGLAHYLEPVADDRRVDVKPVQPASGWNETLAPIAAWEPEYTGQRGAGTYTFENGAMRVGVYLAYYRAQDEAHSLISSSNALATSGNRNWRVSAQGPIALQWGGGEVTFRRTELAGTAERLLVADAYWIDGHVTPNAHHAKVLLAIAKLRGRGDDAALIVISTPKRESDRDADALRQFTAQMSPAIAAALSATRDAR